MGLRRNNLIPLFLFLYFNYICVVDKNKVHFKKVIDTYLVTKYHMCNDINTKILKESKYGSWTELETDKVSEEEFKSNYGNKTSKVSSEKVTIVVEEYPN